MVIGVLVELSNKNIDKIFDYKIPSSNFTCGSRVIVPFGNRKIEGYIINLKEKSDFDDSKLKYVLRVVDDIPVLSQEFLDLANYMHKKTHIFLRILRFFITCQTNIKDIYFRHCLVKIFSYIFSIFNHLIIYIPLFN